MRAYLQDLRLLKTAGYLWGKLFLGNAVPGCLIALGSIHVQNTKAASVLDGLRTTASSGAERQARTDSGAQRNNRAVLVSENGCSLRTGICGHRSARSEGRGGEAGAAETRIETVVGAGGLSGSFTGLCRYQPLAFKGEHPKQRDIGWKRDILAGSAAVTWPLLEIENETRRTGLHFSTVLTAVAIAYTFLCHLL